MSEPDKPIDVDGSHDEPGGSLGPSNTSYDDRIVVGMAEKKFDKNNLEDEDEQLMENKSMNESSDNTFKKNSSSKINLIPMQSETNESMNEKLNSSIVKSETRETEDEEDDEDDEEEDGDDDEDEGEDKEIPVEGSYDPKDYEHLVVSREIKELFQYISKYTTQTIELDHKLQPFVPDYIPAVGDIDAFIKVPSPDEKSEALGLTILDEPCLKQSDPTVLDLQLRAISKQTNLKAKVVKNLQSAGKNPKEIDTWIRSISDLHRSKPPASLHYTKNMPDLDSLMQEWPAEFEELLKKVDLPSADLECDLAEYIDIVCCILDIPIYKSKIQSLHMLFSLYSEFKNSQHFKTLAMENQLDNSLKKERNSFEES